MEDRGSIITGMDSKIFIGGMQKMKNRSMEEVLEYFQQNDVFVNDTNTYVEFVDELKKFQKATADLVIGDNNEYVRMDEVIAEISRLAREKNLANDTRIFEALKGLKEVEKEISITVSGKSGEDRVDQTFQFVNRQDVTRYRNISLVSADGETELDFLVLTKNGFIILEVKTAKSDMTIDEEGRILFEKSSCYHDISIGTKMETKKKLLLEKLEKEFRDANIDKPIFIDTMLVFSNPKGVKIKVDDQYRKQHFCFRGGLFRQIDSFDSSICYTEEELGKINEILNQMQTNQKAYKSKINKTEIKKAFAEAYTLLCDEPERILASEVVVTPIIVNTLETVATPKEQLRITSEKKEHVKKDLLNTGIRIAGGLAAGVILSLVTRSIIHIN